MTLHLASRVIGIADTTEASAPPGLLHFPAIEQTSVLTFALSAITLPAFIQEDA